MIESFETETIRMPLVLTARTYATAVIIVAASSAISFAVVGRRIRRLDLIGVLKARE
jgi:putative ABC transport system permease protein